MAPLVRGSAKNGPNATADQTDKEISSRLTRIEEMLLIMKKKVLDFERRYEIKNSLEGRKLQVDERKSKENKIEGSEKSSKYTSSPALICKDMSN